MGQSYEWVWGSESPASSVLWTGDVMGFGPFEVVALLLRFTEVLSLVAIAISLARIAASKRR